MTHIAEERLVAYALDDAAPEDRAAIEAHLRQCVACRDARDELHRVLAAAASIEVPARGSDYGAQVWARLAPHLPAWRHPRRRFEVPRWLANPAGAGSLIWAAAAVLLIAVSAFVIGRWSASVTSYVMLLIPLVTVVLGAQLDNEVVTPAYFIGGPLVLAGVYLGAFGMPRWSPVRMRGRESETA